MYIVHVHADISQDVKKFEVIFSVAFSVLSLCTYTYIVTNYVHAQKCSSLLCVSSILLKTSITCIYMYMYTCNMHAYNKPEWMLQCISSAILWVTLGSLLLSMHVHVHVHNIWSHDYWTYNISTKREFDIRDLDTNSYTLCVLHKVPCQLQYTSKKG